MPKKPKKILKQEKMKLLFFIFIKKWHNIDITIKRKKGEKYYGYRKSTRRNS